MDKEEGGNHLRILEKQGDEISIIAPPSETVYQGDYLEILDDTKAGICNSSDIRRILHSQSIAYGGYHQRPDN